VSRYAFAYHPRVIPFGPLTAAKPEFTEQGDLRSTLYDDIYASADGAFGQAAHVFLAGNELPHRWRTSKAFVIVETGFGAAINFLAAWGAWRHHAPAAGRLHYISVEKHPFAREDLAGVLRRWPQCPGLAALLLEQYPLPVGGFHRLHFDADRVTLTLVFGDVDDVLPEVDARADAFFLDGFAPARNPQMWSASVFTQIARLAAPGATASTYTVAASVREGMALSCAKRRDSLTSTRCCALAMKEATARRERASRLRRP
jgi:tRNA 5-methylaminomethyl-2-thiouridine biosynthesis bifunctional protein